MTNDSIAVFYICRFQDKDWRKLSSSFVFSYKKFKPGLNHQIYIIFKGFRNKKVLKQARDLFSSLSYKPIEQPDKGFDIGSYYSAALMVQDMYICPLNSHSKILSKDWLNKLYVNICQNNVGLVGATGSYEKIDHFYSLNFPNPHIRTNAFLIQRNLFIRFTSKFSFLEKNDVWKYESGKNSLTNFIKKEGKKVLVIGRDGMAYEENFWNYSKTFKSSNQENLLVSDNQTVFYLKSSWHVKNLLHLKAWGRPLNSFIGEL